MSQTPLIVVVQSGQIELVQALINSPHEVDINALLTSTSIPPLKGKTARICAMESGRSDIMAVLLEGKDIDVAAQDAMSRAALIWAELYNHLGMVKALIHHQVNKWLNTKQVANVKRTHRWPDRTTAALA